MKKRGLVFCILLIVLISIPLSFSDQKIIDTQSSNHASQRDIILQENGEEVIEVEDGQDISGYIIQLREPSVLEVKQELTEDLIDLEKDLNDASTALAQTGSGILNTPVRWVRQIQTNSLENRVQSKREDLPKEVTDHRSKLEQKQKDFVDKLKRSEQNLITGNAILAEQNIESITGILNAVVLDISAQEAQSLLNYPEVISVEPNYVVFADLDQSVDHIGAPDIWNTHGATGAGKVIAILDTGVDYNHQDLGQCFIDTPLNLSGNSLSHNAAKEVAGLGAITGFSTHQSGSCGDGICTADETIASCLTDCTNNPGDCSGAQCNYLDGTTVHTSLISHVTTHNNKRYESVDADGPYIVYSTSTEARLFNQNTQQDILLHTYATSTWYSKAPPRISGTSVVWFDYGSTQGTVYHYDISTGQTQVLSDYTTPRYDIIIEGDNVIWFERRNTPGELRHYNLQTGLIQNLSVYPGVNLREIEISGKLIAYENTVFGSWDVFVYDLETGTNYHVAATSDKDRNPHIYGNKVVYEHWSSNPGVVQVRMHDLETGNTIPIINPHVPSLTDGYNPRITDSLIVWNLEEDFYEGYKTAVYNIITNETKIISSADSTLQDIDSGRIFYTNPGKGNGNISYYLLGPDSDPVCGNFHCESTETEASCPQDCELSVECGNGICEFGENYLTCSQDCDAPTCGDFVCDATETIQTCPNDCQYTIQCGDNECEGNENPTTCPNDCPVPICGNNLCEQFETIQGCPEDCDSLTSCGDGICQYSEGPSECPDDCEENVCGNFVCDPSENIDTCPWDCLATCGNNNCHYRESPYTCSLDCPLNTCGNNICEGNENIHNCQIDCKKVCGDGFCDRGEGPGYCASDCEITCGDGVCDLFEAEQGSCSLDCPTYSGSYVCTDSDGGLGTSKKGRTTYRHPLNPGWGSVVDTCGNPEEGQQRPRVLLEQYCGGESLTSLVYCECENGECLPDVHNHCYDEDDGIYIQRASQVRESGINYSDTCIDASGNPVTNGNRIREYYCQYDDVSTFERDCNCQQGRCVDAICEDSDGNDPLTLGASTYSDGLSGGSRDRCSSTSGSLIEPTCSGNYFTFNQITDCSTVISGGRCDEGVCVSPTCGDGICQQGENCPRDCWVCGDGTCEFGESCHLDCSAMGTCGNGICEGSEDNANCATDCPLQQPNALCGDGLCQNAESEQSCPSDCVAQPFCGDFVCELGENLQSCPNDCQFVSNNDEVCGDGICQASDGICPIDCGGDYCGNGICELFLHSQTQGQYQNENATSCPQDCTMVCGDGICYEGEESCTQDCTGGCTDSDGGYNFDQKGVTHTPHPEGGFIHATDVCVDGVLSGPITIVHQSDFLMERYCDPRINDARGSFTTIKLCNCVNGQCEGDVLEGVCGDGTCSASETPQSCSQDCGNVCGNGICELFEDGSSCSADCLHVCGDGFCAPEEGQHLKCAQDCTSVCGDGICSEDELHVCNADCPNAYCNDNDGGIFPHVQSFAVSQYPHGSGSYLSTVDSCLSDFGDMAVSGSRLFERYCSSGNVDAGIEIFCECEEGRCVYGSSSCIDADNGPNIEQASSVNNSGQIFADTCLDGSGNPASSGPSIREYLCANGGMEVLERPCSCSNGACANAACHETDGGQNYDVFGINTQAPDGSAAAYDSCKSATELIEQVGCYSQSIYDCASEGKICVNGACTTNLCGNSICDQQESFISCPADCEAPPSNLPITTSRVIDATLSNPLPLNPPVDLLDFRVGLDAQTTPGHLGTLLSNGFFSEYPGQNAPGTMAVLLKYSTDLMLVPVQSDGPSLSVAIPQTTLTTDSADDIMLYVAQDGSTYYSRSDHGSGTADLSAAQAMVPAHLAASPFDIGCGDGTCSGNENATTCPADCSVSVCGDGICANDEDHLSCAADCNAPSVCGDSVCAEDESLLTCPQDCATCGNGVCEASETSSSCARDCSACKVIGGYDFVNNDADPMDDHGHGTHVAATAAGKGVLNGVAPDARILGYKVLGSDGTGTFADIAQAIDRALDPNQDGDYSDKADVISMSLGASGVDCDSSYSTIQAINRVVDENVIVTIAAGNCGPSGSSTQCVRLGDETIGYPGCALNAITVGSTYVYDQISGFSSRGPAYFDGEPIIKPDLVAPGSQICAAQWGSYQSHLECIDSEHTSISGTSMATPHVAGAAALLKEIYPQHSAPLIKEILMGSADDIGYAPTIQGAGRINLSKAMIQQVFATPSYLDFGPIDMTNPTYSKTLTLNLKNIGFNDTSFSVSSEVATSGMSLTHQNSVSVVDQTSFSVTLFVNTQQIEEGSHQGTITFSSSESTFSVAYSFSKGFIQITPIPARSQEEITLFVFSPYRLDSIDLTITRPDGSTQQLSSQEMGNDWTFDYSGTQNGSYFVSAVGSAEVPIYGSAQFEIDNIPLTLSTQFDGGNLIISPNKYIEPSMSNPLSFTDYDSIDPTLAADSKGNRHIVWQSDGFELGNSLYHSVYSIENNQWSEPTRISHASYAAHSPELVIDNQDRLHIFYDETHPSGSDYIPYLRYQRYDPLTQSYTNAVSLQAINDFSWQRFHAFVDSTLLHVVYADGNSLSYIQLNTDGTVLDNRQITSPGNFTHAEYYDGDLLLFSAPGFGFGPVDMHRYDIQTSSLSYSHQITSESRSERYTVLGDNLYVQYSPAWDEIRLVGYDISGPATQILSTDVQTQFRPSNPYGVLSDSQKLHLVSRTYDQSAQEYAIEYATYDLSSSQWDLHVVKTGGVPYVLGHALDGWGSGHIGYYQYGSAGGFQSISTVGYAQFRNSPSVQVWESDEYQYFAKPIKVGDNYHLALPSQDGDFSFKIFASDDVGNEYYLDKSYQKGQPINFSPPVRLIRDKTLSSSDIDEFSQKLYVVYEEISGGDFDVLMNRLSSNGNIEAHDVSLADGFGNARYPQVSSSHSQAYAVWQDDRDGNLEIYYSALSSPSATRLTNTVDPSQLPMIDSSYVLWSEGSTLQFSNLESAGVHIVNSNNPLEYDLSVTSSILVVWREGADIFYAQYSTEGVELQGKTLVGSGSHVRASKEYLFYYDGTSLVKYDTTNQQSIPIYFGPLSEYDVVVDEFGVTQLIHSAQNITHFLGLSANGSIETPQTLLSSSSSQPRLALGSVFAQWMENGELVYVSSESIESTPPNIVNVTLDDLGAYYATISWDTDELSDSRVTIGSQNIYNATLTHHHEVFVTDLQYSQTYTYTIESTDATGNTATSNEASQTLQTANLNQLPEFPTTIIGPVIDEVGNPRSGIEVTAYWTDSNDIERTSIATSITPQQAQLLGQANLSGYYFFNNGNVKAKQGTSIILHTPLQVNTQNISVLASPGESVQANNPIILDGIAPAPSLIQPQSIEYPQTSVPLHFTSNEEISYAGYSLNGGSYIEISSFENSEFNITAQVGFNTLTVQVHDQAGLVGLVSRNFTVRDDFAPQITFSVDTYVDGITTLVASATDETSLSQNCQVCITQGVCTWQDAQNTFTIGSSSGTCQYQWDTTTYADGDYDISFRISDEQDNLATSAALPTRVNNIAPPQVTGLDVELIDNTPRLTWAPVVASDLLHYLVLRDESAITSFSSGLIHTNTIETQYYDSSANPATTYYYAIVAVDQGGAYNPSLNSILITIPEFDPPLITITSPVYGQEYGSTDISVGYTANEAVSNCQYSLNGAAYASYLPSIIALEGNNTLTLRCEDTFSNLGESNSVFFTVDTTPPPQVTSLVVNEQNGNVVLNWNSVEDASSYNIYRSIAPFSDSSSVARYAQTTDTTYTDTAVSEQQSYFYAVSGVDVHNREDTSVSAQNTTVPDTTAPVLSISSPTAITYGTTSLTLTYSANEAVTNCGITLNSVFESVSSSGHAFTAAQGANTLVLSCEDLSGNVGTRQVDFTVTLPITPVCGDGTCDVDETAQSCPADCSAQSICGNTICETGEDQNSCPADCSIAPVDPTAWQPPIGIPDPVWPNLHPIRTEKPSEPAGWPSAEVAGYYYIDDTHPSASDANAYGYPNQPRLTIPSTLSAGSYVAIAHLSSTSDITATGTSAQPIWIVGIGAGTIQPAQDETFFILRDSSYVLIDGLYFDGTGTPGLSGAQAFSVYGSDHISLRSSTIANMPAPPYNPDRFNSGGSGAWYGSITYIGASGGDQSDIVLYNNIISNNAGGQNMDYETGRHAVLAAGDTADGYRVERVWIVDNILNNNAEDAIQLGQSSINADQTLCRYFYIGRNQMNNNGENAIDLKATDHIIISENEMRGYVRTNYREGAVSGSDGAANVLNNDGKGPITSWWLFNTISDSRVGMRSQASTGNHYIIGNVFYDLNKADVDTEPTSAGRAGGVAFWTNSGGAATYLLHNTVYDVHGGLYFNNIGEPVVANNIVSDIVVESSGWPININNIHFGTSTIRNNIYYDPDGSVRVDGNAVDTSDTFDTDPGLVNPAQQNFELMSDSIAVDAANSSVLSSVLATYQTEYGVNIAKDIAGTDRPQGAGWDIGAFEYVDSICGDNICSSGENNLNCPQDCTASPPESGSWQPPIGIPAPSFGIEETYRMYDDPANQNPDLTYTQNTEGGLYTHYIDNTNPTCSDSNNEFGTASQPRCSIPGIVWTLPEGSVAEIHGGPYETSRQFWTMNGTLARPVFIRGFDSTNKPIIVPDPGFNTNTYVQGQYGIIENLNFTQGKSVAIVYTSGDPRSIDQQEYLTLRHSEVSFNPVRGAVVLGGDHLVAYDNHIHHNYGNDRHGFTVNEGSNNLWIVDNEAHHNGGQSFQACHNCFNDPPENIYIGRNHFFSDREAAVAFKYGKNIVVSENIMHGYRTAPQNVEWCFDDGSYCGIFTSGSNGPATIVGASGATENVWYLFNTIYDSERGIRIEEGIGQTGIIGNTIYDIHEEAIVLEKRADPIYIIGNTIAGAKIGIDQSWRTDFTAHVHSNIFKNLSDYALYFGSTIVTDRSTVSHNLFDNTFPINIRWGSSTISPTDSSEIDALAEISNSVVSDAQIVSGNDFIISSLSPAWNAGADHSAYDAFTSIFGEQIRVDKSGISRPQGAGWDIGAHEYSEGGSESLCGNFICDQGENENTCSSDCTSAWYCGDLTCDANENQVSCPVDCGAQQCALGVMGSSGGAVTPIPISEMAISDKWLASVYVNFGNGQAGDTRLLIRDDSGSGVVLDSKFSGSRVNIHYENLVFGQFGHEGHSDYIRLLEMPDPIYLMGVVGSNYWTNITKPGVDLSSPDVYNNYIVYQSSDEFVSGVGTGSHIYLYNHQTQTDQRISTVATAEQPHIHGDYVAYQTGNEIQLYSISAGTTVQIATNAILQDMSADYILYQSSAGSDLTLASDNIELYTYAVSDGAITKITNTPYKENGTISENSILFTTQTPNSFDWYISMYDIDSKTTQSFPCDQSHYAAEMFGSRIGYLGFGYPPGSQTLYHYTMYVDTATDTMCGQCETQVCGDGTCGFGEDPNSCPADCSSSVCGNNICEFDETIAQCPQDCDVLAPVVNIISPQETTYSTPHQFLDYSVDDVQANCTYSLQNIIDAPAVAQSTVTGWEGENNLTVRCEDLYGNIGSDSVSFIVDTTPPSPVQITSLYQSGVHAELSWGVSSSADFSYYAIYRSSSAPNTILDMQQIHALSAASYTDTTVSVGNTYYYAVAPVDAVGNVQQNISVANITLTNLPPPAPIAGLTVSAVGGQNSLLLRWDANANASDYRIYRADSSFTHIDQAQFITSTSSLQYIDANLESERTYHYAVTAADQFGEENPVVVSVSGTVGDTSAPAAITNLVVSDVSNERTLSLSWDASTANDLDHYNIYRSASAISSVNGLTPIGISTQPNYEDTNLVSAQVYHYAITAVDDAGNELKSVSSESERVWDTTLPGVAVTDIGSEVVSGDIILSAIVSDNYGLAQCDVCVSVQLPCQWTSQDVLNQFTSGATNGSCAYTWSPTQQGDYFYSFRVTDTYGNSKEGAILSTTVVDPLQPVNLDVSLDAGWNLIAIPLTPVDGSLPNILSSIEGQYTKVFSFDEQTQIWTTYTASRSIFDPQNTLLSLVPGKSYWLHMNQASILSLSGYPLENFQKQLYTGWNFLGWHQLNSTSVDEGMSSLGTNYHSIYGYADGAWIAYRPIPSTIYPNSLSTLEPGKGYVVDMKQSVLYQP